jgi:hypothetical protein
MNRTRKKSSNTNEGLAHEQDGIHHQMLQILQDPPCMQNQGSTELLLTIHGDLPN